MARRLMESTSLLTIGIWECTFGKAHGNHLVTYHSKLATPSGHCTLIALRFTLAQCRTLDAINYLVFPRHSLSNTLVKALCSLNLHFQLQTTLASIFSLQNQECYLHCRRLTDD